MSSIEVSTQTQYLEGDSAPDEDKYVFAYTITITNGGEVPAKLITRHWWITDGQGEVREVHGTGVVGEQPHLQPAQSFRYTSGAILTTPVGAMHGYYEFEADDGSRFDAAIPAFSLSLPNIVH